MPIYIGNSEPDNIYVGNAEIDRAYLGSDLIYEGNTVIISSLPISFTARAQQALKNYRIYGTAAGAGVATDNLYNYQNKNTNNGYVSNNYIKSNGDLSSNSAFDVSEYIPVEGNTTYYLYWRINTSSVPGYVFYNENKERVNGGTYGNQSGANITTPSTARFLRFSVRKNAQYTTLIGLYMTEPNTPVPYGYQLPLTITSGQNTDTYQLYIGSSKLESEEYLDYDEQKIYKRNPASFICPVEANGNYIDPSRPTVNFIQIIWKFDVNMLSYFDRGGLLMKIGLSDDFDYSTASAASDFTAEQMRSVWEMIGKNTGQFQLNSDTYPEISVRTFVKIGSDYFYGDIVQITKTEIDSAPDKTISYPVLIPYRPIDPPVPFPAITVYPDNTNILTSTETLGTVTLVGKIEEIQKPSWFTPEWYAAASTYLDSAFTFKPSNLYMDLIYDYYRLSDDKHVHGITRIYWWNNPAPDEPIKIFVDPNYISNNNYWWCAETDTAANDYWYPGSYYEDEGTWTEKEAPHSVQITKLPLIEYAYYIDYDPIRAPALFYAGGNVTADITYP